MSDFEVLLRYLLPVLSPPFPPSFNYLASLFLAFPYITSFFSSETSCSNRKPLI